MRIAAEYSSWNDTFGDIDFVYSIDTDKLILVLAITFGFILFLLLSLLCIFYFMGFMQNQFGYTWLVRTDIFRARMLLPEMLLPRLSAGASRITHCVSGSMRIPARSMANIHADHLLCQASLAGE